MTGVADSFDPNASSANSGVFAIAVQADGKILVGGDFVSIGGQTRNRIARLDAITGAADSFDPNANGAVYSIACSRTARFWWVAFLPPSAARPPFSCPARSRDRHADSFDPNVSNLVYTIAVQADGKILAGGDFSEPTASADRRAITSPGSMAPPGWLIRSTRTQTVLSIRSRWRADGKILAGGSFNIVGGQTRSLFARLSNDTAALQNLAVSQTAISWTRGGSSPQFTRVAFEYSTDNVSYTPLGIGTASGSNWTLTGLNLPTGQNFYIRARGHYRSGNGASESIRSPCGMPF